MKNESLAVCPIPGCNMHYTRGILGWHKHVERKDAHPFWHPDLDGAPARKAAFVAEFPDWFTQAVGHQTPAAIRASTPKPPPPTLAPRTPAPGAMRATATAPRMEPAVAPESTVRELLERLLQVLIILEAKLPEAGESPNARE